MNQNHVKTENIFASTNTFAYFLMGYLLWYVRRKRTIVFSTKHKCWGVSSPIIKAAFIVYSRNICKLEKEVHHSFIDALSLPISCSWNNNQVYWKWMGLTQMSINICISDLSNSIMQIYRLMKYFENNMINIKTIFII